MFRYFDGRGQRAGARITTIARAPGMTPRGVSDKHVREIDT
jgi:hypothetical protein